MGGEAVTGTALDEAATAVVAEINEFPENSGDPARSPQDKHHPPPIPRPPNEAPF